MKRAAIWIACVFLVGWAIPAPAQTDDPPATEVQAGVPDVVNPTPNQAGADAPPAQQDEPAPAEGAGKEVRSAEVVAVVGTAEWAEPGTSVVAVEGWTAVTVGDLLPPGTVLRTGLRSSVDLAFGEHTFISVRAATFASVSQYYREATRKTDVIRMDLGYGTVRGGSFEGEIRADVVVDSPTATLAKRGTDGWQMSVEAGTGRFEISLARYGLVDAVQKLAGNRRLAKSVRPGEYANQSNIAGLWLQQNIFDRSVTSYQTVAVSEADASFSMANQRGYGVLAPGAGTELAGMADRNNPSFLLDQAQSGNPATTPTGGTILLLPPLGRPEGNFGTANAFNPNASRRVFRLGGT
jgi:hypothetical protein